MHSTYIEITSTIMFKEPAFSASVSVALSGCAVAGSCHWGGEQAFWLTRLPFLAHGI